MQAPGVKGELSPGQAVKKPKVEISTDVAKAVSTESADANATGPILQAEVSTDKIVNMENLVSQKSISSSAEALQDLPNLKQTVRPMATSATPFPMNRYKLDNRPTAFRINAPLPIALANVSTASSTPLGKSLCCYFAYPLTPIILLGQRLYIHVSEFLFI